MQIARVYQLQYCCKITATVFFVAIAGAECIENYMFYIDYRK